MYIEIKFREILQSIREEEGSCTKIAVIGQPGSGKSSLINNLVGKKVAETGPETDVTVEIRKYDFEFMKIYDTPGYGTKKFSFLEWRKTCRPEQFDLLIYVFSGKFIDADDSLFDELRSCNKPLFLVRNFCEDLCEDDKKVVVKQDMKKRYSNFKKIYFVCCGRVKEGIDELKKDVLNVEFRNLWKNRVVNAFENAKISYLCQAQRKASDDIDTYKKLAGANGINPIPIGDVAVDLGIYFKMFSDIREAYGIDQRDFSTYMAIPVAKKLLALLTEKGIVVLLKSFGTKYVTRTALKYIPFIGQAAAFMIGWKLCKAAGDDYSEQCSTFAKEVMHCLINKEVESITNQFG